MRPDSCHAGCDWSPNRAEDRNHSMSRNHCWTNQKNAGVMETSWNYHKEDSWFIGLKLNKWNEPLGKIHVDFFWEFPSMFHCRRRLRIPAVIFCSKVTPYFLGATWCNVSKRWPTSHLLPCFERKNDMVSINRGTPKWMKFSFHGKSMKIPSIDGWWLGVPLVQETSTCFRCQCLSTLKLIDEVYRLCEQYLWIPLLSDIISQCGPKPTSCTVLWFWPTRYKQPMLLGWATPTM